MGVDRTVSTPGRATPRQLGLPFQEIGEGLPRPETSARGVIELHLARLRETGGNPGIAQSLRTLYPEEPAGRERTGLDSEIFAYVDRACEAAKG